MREQSLSAVRHPLLDFGGSLDGQEGFDGPEPFDRLRTAPV